MLSTIKDLARIAGVSHSTVSRSLNNSPLISKETKEKIRNLANAYHIVTFPMNSHTGESNIKKLIKRKKVDGLLLAIPDIKIGSFLRPRLTTIHQPGEKYAVLACERLVELINKENHTQRMQMAVELTLIVRESCGKGD